MLLMKGQATQVQRYHFELDFYIASSDLFFFCTGKIRGYFK